MRRQVHFYSDGIRLAGLLFTPDDASSPERRPAIVFSHGYTGSKEGQVARHAEALLEAGFVCLTLDHRGFGESEGERGRLIAHERVEDIKSAITFLAQQLEVDPQRIGLFGLSVGAAVVLYAGLDPRVKCVVSVSAFGDGERWLRSLRRYWEWHNFLKILEEDRVTRTLTGQSRRVDALEIMLPPPELDSHYVGRRERGSSDEWSRPLESADSLLAFKPETIAGQLAPKAVLLLHGDADTLAPLDEAYCLYESLNQPRRLAIVPGATHVGMYESHFEQAITIAAEFLNEYLR